MRSISFVAVALCGLGCTAEVPDSGGFGSGAEGGSPTGGETVDGETEPGETATPGDSSNSNSNSDSNATSGAATSGADTDTPSGDGDGSGDAESASDSDPSDSDGSGGSDSSGTSDGGSSEDSGGEDSSGEVGSDPCGFPLDGPWLEIEYWQAGVPATSPSWEYSATPGWGEDEWAAQNASWPEMWDLYQNINVVNDPIGTVAVVGSSAQLQLMLGFEELIDYDYATLCVEGRSVSAVSSVQFDAYNPLTGLGNSASMAHDWSVHAVGIDLGQCFTIGGGVQAVRLDTTGGSASLGVQRMRLVLHGAVY